MAVGENELRAAPDGAIVGMTFVDPPVLSRSCDTPLLLRRVAGQRG